MEPSVPGRASRRSPLGRSTSARPTRRSRSAQAGACNQCVQIPWALTATAVAFRIDGVRTPASCRRPLVAQICLGQITKWNDPRIAKVNKGVTLPNLEDHAGRSAATVPATRTRSPTGSRASARPGSRQVGNATTVSFPVGVGGKGNDGVTAVISSTNGAHRLHLGRLRDRARPGRRGARATAPASLRLPEPPQHPGGREGRQAGAREQRDAHRQPAEDEQVGVSALDVHLRDRAEERSEEGPAQEVHPSTRPRTARHSGRRSTSRRSRRSSTTRPSGRSTRSARDGRGRATRCGVHSNVTPRLPFGNENPCKGAEPLLDKSRKERADERADDQPGRSPLPLDRLPGGEARDPAGPRTPRVRHPARGGLRPRQAAGHGLRDDHRSRHDRGGAVDRRSPRRVRLRGADRPLQGRAPGRARALLGHHAG